MVRLTGSFLTLVVTLGLVLAQPPKKDAWFDKAVKKIEMTFEPAEALPGQTVTMKVLVHLADNYYTYPMAQPDKAAEGMVNKIEFPKPGGVIFVGDVTDPADYQVKAEPILGIRELRYLTGKTVYERKLVVNPSQKPGLLTVKLPALKLNICDPNVCFPTKSVPVEGTLKIKPGPAQPVEKAYEAEVKKAIEKL